VFKKVDKLKKGQYVRISGQLFMLGYKHYTPMLMQVTHGMVLQGAAVSSMNSWNGMAETTFRDSFDKHRFVKNSTAIEFLELVEDEAVPATLGSHIMVTSPGPSSSYISSAPLFTITSS
jgi:hypothetical protein